MKKSELKGVRDLLKELKTRIKTPYDGTDEELKEEVKNFKKQLSVKQKEIEEQEEQIKQFNAEELTLSGRLMKEQGMLGQLLKEKELNAERVKQRDEEIISLAVKLNADG